jgi:predicted O-methyltransferase YrrM
MIPAAASSLQPDGTIAADAREARRRALLDNDGYRFTRALVHGRPYFGPRMASAQGDSQRHVWMTAAVAALARDGRDTINILELGSWAGGSTITWARAIQASGVAGRVFCVDHWRQQFDLDVNRALVYDEMVRATRERAIAGLFRHNITAAGVADRVVVLESETAPLLPLLGARRFDVVFIDASHLYADVLADLRGAIPLVAEGGILSGDDLELQMPRCDTHTLTTAIEQNADFVTDPLTQQGYHPGVTAAVAEVLGSVSEWNGFWAVQRQGDRWNQPLLVKPAVAPYSDHLSVSQDPLRVDVQFIGDYAVYDADDGAIALRHDILPEDLARTPRDVWERSDLVVAAPDLASIEARIAEIGSAPGRSAAIATMHERTEAQPGTPPNVPSLVQENYCGYNVVRFAGRYYAIAQRIGPIDIATADIPSLQDNRTILAGSSVRDVLLMIDGLQLAPERSKLTALETQLATAHQALSLTDARITALESTLKDRERQLDQQDEHARATEKRMSAVRADLEGLARRTQELDAALRASEADRAELVKWIEELHSHLARATGGRRQRLSMFGR